MPSSIIPFLRTNHAVVSLFVMTKVKGELQMCKNKVILCFFFFSFFVAAAAGGGFSIVVIVWEFFLL